MFAAVPASYSVARKRTFATLPASCPIGGQGAFADVAASRPIGGQGALASVPASRSIARERTFAGVRARRPIGGRGAVAGVAASPVDGQRSLTGAAAFGPGWTFAGDAGASAFNGDDAFPGVAAGLPFPASLAGFAGRVGAGLGTSCRRTGRAVAAGEAGDRSGRGVITVEGAARAVAGHGAILPQPA
ncbi:hypothetical protein [Amycolatopsis magusensis]|uniref:hypothetical protein n=1 Tax=Amycolatopsis magusensis TaxID=882444 RepID=UPI0037A9CDBD